MGTLLNKLSNYFSSDTAKLIDFNSPEYTRGLQMAIDNKQRGMASENNYLYSNPAYARAATDTAAAYYMEAQKLNKEYDPRLRQQQFLNDQLLMGSAAMFGGMQAGVKGAGQLADAALKGAYNYFSPKQSYSRGLADTVYSGAQNLRSTLQSTLMAPINALKNVFIR
ncbi:MAG: hypothetical protein ACRCX2_05755 [Paraclostridium sp.]